MQLDDRITASEDVVSREVSGETVLMDLASGTYFGLNAVGGRIWQLLDDEAHTVAELCKLIAEEFDAPLENVQRDILALTADLEQHKLIFHAQ